MLGVCTSVGEYIQNIMSRRGLVSSLKLVVTSGRLMLLSGKVVRLSFQRLAGDWWAADNARIEALI
jgi:hypothetical protein